MLYLHKINNSAKFFLVFISVQSAYPPPIVRRVENAKFNETKGKKTE